MSEPHSKKIKLFTDDPSHDIDRMVDVFGDVVLNVVNSTNTTLLAQQVTDVIFQQTIKAAKSAYKAIFGSNSFMSKKAFMISLVHNGKSIPPKNLRVYY